MNATAKTSHGEATESSSLVFRQQLEQRLSTFADALPPHITPARFKGVISWAVMADPSLLDADRVSLFEACLAAANDGLVPDKREGALVVYNTRLPKKNKNDKNERDVWIRRVQWLPMVRGIITKILNTGKVKSVKLDVVYGGDEYRTWTDDDGPHLIHNHAEDRDKSIIRRVYAHIVMKESEGSGVYFESLDMADIEKIRKASKTSDFGPWKDWWEEMAKKSALKRLAKVLPIRREIEATLDRDNFLYDMDLKPSVVQRQAIPSLGGRLDALAGTAQHQISHQQTQGVPFDPETGEIREPAEKEPPAEKKADGQKKSSANPKPPAQKEDSEASDSETDKGSDAEGEGDNDPEAAAFAAGQKARAAGMSRRGVPAEYRNDEKLIERFLAGFDGDKE